MGDIVVAIIVIIAINTFIVFFPAIAALINTEAPLDSVGGIQRAVGLKFEST